MKRFTVDLISGARPNFMKVAALFVGTSMMSSAFSNRLVR